MASSRRIVFSNARRPHTALLGVLALAVLCTLSRLQAQAPATPVSEAHFTDVADRLGLHVTARAYHTATKYLIETMGSGVAAFDYDNDGLLDILFINGAPLTASMPHGSVPQKRSPADWDRLFHQKKDGTFEDVTEKSGLEGIGYGMGVAIGDYDNDGFEDVYVTAYGGNRLYHNTGKGTFVDVTERSGTGGETQAGYGWSTSAAWVDLDNDGKLDLVVLRYVKWDFDDTWCGEHREGYRAYCHPDMFPAIRPLVYRNNGDGTFTECAEKFGLSAPGKGLGIAFADFNLDGRIDLAIANDSMPQFLYRNNGRGGFDEIGLLAEIAIDGDGRTYAGMGIDFQDYNNDGLPDLITTNLANQKYALYRNNGDESFTYATYLSGLARVTQLSSGWGVHFLDYDNDGFKDLLVSQGHDLDTIELNYPELHYKEPMLLARNNGHGKFINISREAGAPFQIPWVGRGLAIGDFDNDGKLDAVVTTNDGAAHLLHNETRTANHWLTVLLTGHTSNRDALGATIKVTTVHGAQVVTVSTAGSYLSSSDKRAHFGLGDADKALSIQIRWPSGITQEIGPTAADQLLRVDEPPPVPSPPHPHP